MRITPELWERMDKAVALAGVSRSEWIRDLILGACHDSG
jgi:metal-responsive CopG/Arc/MetJ family transcriptional regulator